VFYRRHGKRLFDVTLSAAALVLLAPVLGLIALAIKLTSRGPVFYVQERIGRDAAPFPFIKFRTMVTGAETQGAGILCVRNDPRVTSVGRLLRRFSLDEIPQLVNVLRGEMSVIGPRPGLAYQVQAYTPFQRRRLTVLPGITGWAQVNGRNAIAWDQRIIRDVEYVERLSFAMDLRILRRTVRAVLGSDSLIAERDYFKAREALSQEAQSGEQH
jgi:lipopolysaccharide/colanic/teichoic acid biosynthesis glycosyltransferase